MLYPALPEDFPSRTGRGGDKFLITLYYMDFWEDSGPYLERFLEVLEVNFPLTEI